MKDLHDGLQIQKGRSIEKTARVTSDTEGLGKHQALNQVPMKIELHAGAGAPNIDDLQSSVESQSPTGRAFRISLIDNIDKIPGKTATVAVPKF